MPSWGMTLIDLADQLIGKSSPTNEVCCRLTPSMTISPAETQGFNIPRLRFKCQTILRLAIAVSL